jgi:hypothetical protein
MTRVAKKQAKPEAKPEAKQEAKQEEELAAEWVDPKDLIPWKKNPIDSDAPRIPPRRRRCESDLAAQIGP